jgi:hypothetical protein
VSIVACAGTALLRPWSRYLVYGLTVFFVGGWFYSVYHGYSVEYFRFFFESPAAVAKALAPGLALVVLSCAASWMTYSHFRMARGVTKT